MPSMIKLNNEEEYAVDFCGLSDGVLAFRLRELMTALGAAEIFSDPRATQEILYLLPNEQAPDHPIVAAVYDDCTRLIGVLIDRRTGAPLIQLTKEG